ncbi:protein LLP homolog [Fopius arisanus]|uniref:Protein LLP homolog n=1 Tax=Fopius arisanus TaxID=64838 RepID=A0A9R1TP37_9HYME|nr:PREDICTED: protein LLP homolog [Fopius arisanus]XP_011312759.1 PREDICTED: protein LLP homolog [Fopius arisanus]
MAKSLRSKWRRKCRAVKRERYGAKELARLKKTLGIDENTTQQDVEMSDITEIATVTDAQKIRESVKPEGENPQEGVMEVEGKRIYNKRTMKDQYGNYPVWMNKRKIVKHKKGRGKNAKATAKQSKRLTRRQKKNAQSK